MGTSARSLVAVFCVGVSVVACTTQETNPDGGGSGGKGGTSVGGSGGAGGSVGTAETDGVACTKPTKALLTDFTYTVGDGGTTSTSTIHFGDSTTLQGGQFFYPESGTYALTSDMTNSNWHMSGTLGDYSGFGLFFDNCNRIDASAYKGIQFTLSGTVEKEGTITMGMGTLNNTLSSAWLNDNHGGDGSSHPGRCTPKSGTNKYTQTECKDTSKVIPVAATPTVVKLLWSDFTGGKPDTGVTPTDILSFYWFFPPPTGAGTTTPTTYRADIVIDDLKFIE